MVEKKYSVDKVFDGIITTRYKKSKHSLVDTLKIMRYTIQHFGKENVAGYTELPAKVFIKKNSNDVIFFTKDGHEIVLRFDGKDYGFISINDVNVES